MFRRFLALVVTLPTLVTITSNVVACNWNLEPTVLLLTSFNQAEYQNNNDKIIYNELINNYGQNHVVTLFTMQDDNQYAVVLRNLLSTYDIKKVFILNPSFQKYLPHTSNPNQYFTNNLTQVIQQFNDVNFYFFNNIIADTLKVTNNIFDIRFNVPNDIIPNPIPYGQQLAKRFIEKINDPASSYVFDADELNQKIVKIGIINNIGNDYQQEILNQFIANVKALSLSSSSLKIKYQFIYANPNQTFVTNNIHSADGIQLIGKIAQNFYEKQGVNFIVNSNSWYNNIISYEASLISDNDFFNKTMQFIAADIINPNNYIYKNHNYLALGYTVNYDFIDKKTGTIDNNFKIPDTAGLEETKFQTYGINNFNIIE